MWVQRTELAPKGCLQNPGFSIQDEGVNLRGSNVLNVFASSLFFPHSQKDFNFLHLNLSAATSLALINSREFVRMGENLKVPISGRLRVALKGTILCEKLRSLGVNV